MFTIYRPDDGRNMPLEYLPCGAIQPKIGLALTQTSGNLAIASGTTRPTYICMTERSKAVEAGEIIPVVRVGADVIWETTASAAFTSVKQGDKVTISTDGLQVTATTTSGVAEVIDFDGTAAGSTVRVRFPAAAGAAS